MARPIVPRTLRANTRKNVPPLVQYLLGLFHIPMLAWLTTLVYRNLFLRCADHPLVLLNAYYDFAPVVAACAHFHHAPGTKGSPPTYPVELLVRAEFLRSWAASCSDPDLEWLLVSSLLVRWLVGLPLPNVRACPRCVLPRDPSRSVSPNHSLNSSYKLV